MLVDVKNTKTGEVLHEKLEVTDIMHGAYTGDDRFIVFLPEGEPLIFAPMEDYLISAHEEQPPEPEPAEPPEPPTREQQYKALVTQHIHERYSLDDEIAMLYKDEHDPEFVAYRAYVKACKVRAEQEVYGEGEDE